jgi:hypothetical protein
VPAGSIENNEEHDMAVDMDMVNGVILELYLAEKNKAARKRARKKESKPKTKKREGKGERYSWRMTSEEEGHESEGGKAEIPESDPAEGGEARAWTCKKNNGRRWFCRRPVSRPDSLCTYHSQPKLPGSWKPRRKRATAFGVLALPKIERTISRQLDGSSGNTTRRIRVTQLLVYELAGTSITTRHTQRTAATNRSPRACIMPSCFSLLLIVYLVLTTGGLLLFI